MLVIDIETVPFLDNEYSDTQKEYIDRKLTTALKRDPNLNVLSETGKIKGTDPYLSRIVCIGMYYPLTNVKYALTNDDEKIILESFWAQLAGYSGLFITYNGVRFDTPYIIKRSMKHGIKPTNRSFLQYTKYDANPPHFDVYLQLGREQSYSLKAACDFFGVPSPKDGAVNAEGVAAAYYDGRIQEIADYCLRDLDSTYKLYQIVSKYIVSK